MGHLADWRRQESQNCEGDEEEGERGEVAYPDGARIELGRPAAAASAQEAPARASACGCASAKTKRRRGRGRRRRRRSKMRTRDREIEGPGAAWTPRPDSQILGGPASCRQAIDSRFPRLWSATQRPPKPPAPRRRGRTTHRCSTQSLLADARRSHNERLTSGRLLHPRCPGLAALGRSVVAAVPLGP